MRKFEGCRRLTVVGAVCILGLLHPAAAQDPGVAARAAGVGAGVSDPMDAASACVRENGFQEGYSKTKGVFVTVASAGFACGPDNPESFTDCRNAAFQTAMLSAKKQIAEFLSAEIASYVKNSYEEPSQADAAIKDMGGGRARDLVESSGAGDAEQRRQLSSEKFLSAVSVVAKQEVAAVQCFRSFESVNEGKGRVAVVAILSPKSIQMAQAMLGQSREGVTGTAKGPIVDWVGSIESDGQLLYTHGVIQRTNENGELCLVAFGQSSPRTASERSMDAAYSKARNNAFQVLRQFAGEMVVSASDQSTGFSLDEFSDATSEFVNDSSFKEAVEARASKLTLPGASQVRRAKLKHPLGGDIPTAVVVLEWNVSSADAANELKATLDAMRGSEGGKGRAGLKPADAAKQPAPKKPTTPGDSGGRGGSGSSDDT